MQVFVKGETIYKVYALLRSEEHWIEKYTVVANTTMLDEKVPALLVLNKGREDTISLRDGNVIPNTYSCSRIFKSSEAAESYVADPSSWRPLGFSVEDWENHAKAAYLAKDYLSDWFYNNDDYVEMF